MAKREVLRKELSALTPDELRFLVTRQLRCVTVCRWAAVDGHNSKDGREDCCS